MLALLVTLLALPLAVHRVTRLVVHDSIPLIKVPRDKLCNWLDPQREPGAPLVPRPPLGGFGRSVAYLLTCEWCTSVWVAGGLVTAVALLVGGLPWPVWVLVGLTCSSLTGLVAERERD